jgi:hypothetical protein
MNEVRIVVLLVMLVCLTLVSCQSKLNRDSQHICEGMTKDQVAKHFSGYGVIYSGTSDVVHLQSLNCTQLFQSNSLCASRVTFNNKNPSLFDFENCTVFFDEKDVIIGYKYERPD